jgi:hypothetical protein
MIELPPLFMCTVQRCNATTAGLGYLDVCVDCPWCKRLDTVRTVHPRWEENLISAYECKFFAGTVFGVQNRFPSHRLLADISTAHYFIIGRQRPECGTGMPCWTSSRTGGGWGPVGRHGYTGPAVHEWFEWWRSFEYIPIEEIDIRSLLRSHCILEQPLHSRAATAY